MKTIIPILICFILFPLQSDNKSEYVIPGGAYSVCSSDIDNDNDYDIISGHLVAWGYTYKSISILENINKGIFTVKDTSKSFCGYQKNIFAIQVNNDTFPDLVTFYSDHTSGTQRYIRVYYNEQGNFNNYINFNLNSDATFAHINYGRINNDELNDIVVISNNDHFWGILYNDGNGGFTTPEYFNISGSYPTDIACGDLNGDGREDVVVGGAKLEIYYSFDTGFVQYLLGQQQDKIQIADIDHDGDNDVVCLAGGFSTTFATIYENLCNNEFFKHETVTYNPYCWRFVLSDLNNDSLPDLVTVNNDNGLYLLYNEGNFQLSYPVLVPVPITGVDFLSTCCADLDSNSYNDLIVVRSTGYLNILFNDGNGNFVEDPITDIENPNTKIQNPILKCYPNPFKGSTQIWYKLEYASNIQINIYNYTGQLIESFDEGTKTKGNHSIEFNAFGLTPGIYYYILDVNGKTTDSKKMVIMN